MQQFTGMQYLKMDIMNNLGYDKLTYQEKLDLFEEKKEQILNLSLLDTADSPACAYAAIQAYIDAENDKPVGYPISLDATASGLQILCCLTDDIKGAELCNLINTGKREDAYTTVYNAVMNSNEALSSMRREDVKQAVMTSLYSSKSIPKKVFGSHINTFYKVMHTLAPKAWELNEFLFDAWDNTKTRYDWTLPDLFTAYFVVEDSVKSVVTLDGIEIPCVIKVSKPVEQGRCLSANITHSYDALVAREMVRRCSYDKSTISNVASIIAKHLNNNLFPKEQLSQINIKLNAIQNSIEPKNKDNILTEITQINRNSKHFPNKIKNLAYRMTNCLYALGNTSLLDKPAIGVVGSRDLAYSKDCQLDVDNTKIVAKKIVEANQIIVSGGAIGADSITTTAVLEMGGSAIIYLPLGITAFMDKDDSGIYKTALKEGRLLIYSLKENTTVSKSEFTKLAFQRNAYIYSQSSATIIIRCTDGKGGTFGGAKEALTRKYCQVIVLENQTGTGVESLELLGAKVVNSNDLVIPTITEDNEPEEITTDIGIRLWDMYKKCGFLSASILNYITKENIGYMDTKVILNLIQSLPPMPFEIICRHDSFAILPNYGNYVRQQYTNILVELANSTCLNMTLQEAIDKTIHIDKELGLGDMIKQNEYALC